MIWNNTNNSAPSCDGDSCCTPKPKGKANCPMCSTPSKGVLGKTLDHLLRDETKEKLTCLDGFYFCKTPSCDVIYFREDEVLVQKDLFVPVGCKEGASPATLCYCFDWNKEKIKAEFKEKGVCLALEDIMEKMEALGCSCEILNPSGRCCLGDVAKAIKNAQKELDL